MSKTKVLKHNQDTYSSDNTDSPEANHQPNSYVTTRDETYAKETLSDITTSKIENTHNTPSIHPENKIQSPISHEIRNQAELVPISQSYISSPEANLVNTYNDNPNVLRRQVIKVSQTEKSIKYRRQGYNEPIVFTRKNNENYWIINDNQNPIYMVPKINLKLNKYNFENIQNVFYLDGYQPNLPSAQRFKLHKPAIVTILGKDWELRERGRLQFY